MRIYKEFTFEAAHRLPYVPEGHKCGRLHGHSYKVTLTVEGQEQYDGMVMDFADIKKAWKPLDEQLDHYYINQVKGLENPTCENLAEWIGKRVELRGLVSVEVKETCTSGAIYTCSST